jgi:hypothetical protein
MKMKDNIPNKRHSWITVYPLAMAAMNSAKTRRGKFESSPYEAVFGLQYHEPMITSFSIEKLWTHKSVESRVNMLGSGFKAKMIAIKEIETENNPISRNTVAIGPSSEDEDDNSLFDSPFDTELLSETTSQPNVAINNSKEEDTEKAVSNERHSSRTSTKAINTTPCKNKDN